MLKGPCPLMAQKFFPCSVFEFSRPNVARSQSWIWRSGIGRVTRRRSGPSRSLVPGRASPRPELQLGWLRGIPGLWALSSPHSNQPNQGNELDAQSRGRCQGPKRIARPKRLEDSRKVQSTQNVLFVRVAFAQARFVPLGAGFQLK